MEKLSEDIVLERWDQMGAWSEEGSRCHPVVCNKAFKEVVGWYPATLIKLHVRVCNYDPGDLDGLEYRKLFIGYHSVFAEEEPTEWSYFSTMRKTKSAYKHLLYYEARQIINKILGYNHKSGTVLPIWVGAWYYEEDE